MIDYIFYRVYWAYNKKRESAKFLSPLYMAMVFAFLFFPFALFLCELLRDSYHRNDGYLLSIYLLMILIYSYLRFFPNKKIWLINKKFDLSIGWGSVNRTVSRLCLHYPKVQFRGNEFTFSWNRTVPYAFFLSTKC